MPFSDEQKQSAIQKAKLETKNHNIKYYKNILIVGVIIFLGGGNLTFLNILTLYFGKGGRFSLWLILLTFVGIGQILWGIRGLRTESKD